MTKVAALFVERGGCYFGLDDVDPWDQERDARLYAGPWPVVCHPPCERWGRYWSGGPNPSAKRRLKGDDGGCFAAALRACRLYGGVLEHPEASHAWAAHGLAAPPKSGGWVIADKGGYTCCVEQGHYGHPARKATWLYAYRTDRPELQWGSSGSRQRLEPGFHSAEERRRAPAARRLVSRLSAAQNRATPLPFRDLLLSIARSARP